MSKIIFGQSAVSKAEMRAQIAAANLGKSSAPMASAENLKAYSNVPGMNFRGTHTKSSANRSKANCYRIIVDHAGREFYQNAEGEWI